MHPIGWTSADNFCKAMGLTFEVGDARIKDLENSNWVGNGRFLFEGDKLWVEVRVSQVVSSEDMD